MFVSKHRNQKKTANLLLKKLSFKELFDWIKFCYFLLKVRYRILKEKQLQQKFSVSIVGGKI